MTEQNNLKVTKEFWGLLRKYNVVYVGDKGMNVAIENFLIKYGVKKRRPTMEQKHIMAFLDSTGAFND